MVNRRSSPEGLTNDLLWPLKIDVARDQNISEYWSRSLHDRYTGHHDPPLSFLVFLLVIGKDILLNRQTENKKRQDAIDSMRTRPTFAARKLITTNSESYS
ncbi:hypothetical protein E2C01_083698 [Portunus trituberculatus]|uniref:Uncharacterized protein n=1 Tax=Portunus trituberculatus TaxID=210409 RepID=A0A5B7J5J6_PORTR|nr:hypothetical protein [Portunus trituberculatus]